MAIFAKNLRHGDRIICRDGDMLIEGAVVSNVELYGQRYIIVDNDTMTLHPEEAVQRAVENLVPAHLRDHLGKPGKLPYEVLVFHTEHEYEVPRTEAELKKLILAKFRDYQEALEYARRHAITPMYYRVILRA